MIDARDEESDVGPKAPETPAGRNTFFGADVESICGGVGRLAAMMTELEDDRPQATIMRAVNRMIAGDVRVSGEIRVVLALMRRQKLRSEWLKAKAEWVTNEDGSVSCELVDFSITIYPARGARWRAEIVHKRGYRAPWPRWQNNIEDAKSVAIDYLLTAESDLIEDWAYRAGLD